MENLVVSFPVASKPVRMKSLVMASSLALASLVGLSAGCTTTSATSQTWVAQPPPPQWVRHGHVEWVREVVVRRDGNPVGGAVAGAVIGSLLGGRHALFGAATGAAVGAAASQGHEENRRYELLVRFDDGYTQMFVYGGASPFAPGESVLLTPQGLMRG